MFVKLKNWLQEFRLSLKMKVTLALSAIAVVLLMSSIISVLEYRRMSNYVSDMIADDIRNIHLTQKLVDAVDTYNLQLLAVIGDDNLSTLPDFDRSAFLDYCDSLRASFGAGKTVPMADSVVYAYSAYMLASMELEDVLESNFINTRDWYFSRLQPLFGRMRGYLDRLSTTMYMWSKTPRTLTGAFSAASFPVRWPLPWAFCWCSCCCSTSWCITSVPSTGCGRRCKTTWNSGGATPIPSTETTSSVS